VCFAPYRVDLVFAQDVKIKVFGQLDYTINGRTYAWREDGAQPRFADQITTLVTHSVVTAAVEPRATLVLAFDNGGVLRVVEDVSNYECYHLLLGEREIIV